METMGFTWNLGKNSKLKEERGVSFEDVVRCVIAGNFSIQRNTSKFHPGQSVFVVRMKGRPWWVPFRKSRVGYHLYTILPKD